MSQGTITIGNINFSIQSLKVNWESLQADDSGRTDDGVMHITWVKRKVRKLEIGLPPCTSQKISALFSLIQGQEYNITYFDPLENQKKTIKVYTSNSAAECYNGVLKGGLWQNAAFNAIELAGE